MIQEKLDYPWPLTVVDPLLNSVKLNVSSLRGKYVLFVVFHGANHNVSTAEFIRFCEQSDAFRKEKIFVLGICRETNVAIKDWITVRAAKATEKISDRRLPVISDMAVDGLLVELGVPVIGGYPVPVAILMDRSSQIRAATFSCPRTGCSVSACLRMVGAVRAVDRAGGTALAPCDWHKGHQYIHNSMSGVESYYSELAGISKLQAFWTRLTGRKPTPSRQNTANSRNTHHHHQKQAPDQKQIQADNKLTGSQAGATSSKSGQKVKGYPISSEEAQVLQQQEMQQSIHLDSSLPTQEGDGLSQPTSAGDPATATGQQPTTAPNSEATATQPQHTSPQTASNEANLRTTLPALPSLVLPTLEIPRPSTAPSDITPRPNPPGPSLPPVNSSNPSTLKPAPPSTTTDKHESTEGEHKETLKPLNGTTHDTLKGEPGEDSNNPHSDVEGDRMEHDAYESKDVKAHAGNEPLPASMEIGSQRYT